MIMAAVTHADSLPSSSSFDFSETMAQIILPKTALIDQFKEGALPPWIPSQS
jgi:hypothetical protein